MPGTARRSIYAAYDTLGPRWQTTLLLNNTTRAPIAVAPTVYSPEGAGILLSAVSLEPHEHKRLDFAQWIAPLGRDYVRGSLRLQFESVPFGLGAILSSVNREKGQVVEAVLHSALELKSSRLEAIWSVPGPAGRLTVSVLNITGYSLNASIRVTSRDGSVLRDEVLPLAPHQARFLNLRGMTREQERVGGIRIEHGGSRGAVFAQGFVLEPSGGLAYSIPFTDPATLGDAKFSGAGILLGRHGGHGQEDMTFEGRLLLRNISQAPLAAEPVLQRGQAKLSLGNFSLEAGEAVEIPVPATAVPPGEGAIGIELPHSGSVEDMIAQWFSIETRGMVVETPMRSVGPEEHVGGSNPFLLAGDYRSVTYIKNTGTERARAVAWIEHAAGQYMLGLQDVPAGETLAIDIGKLRDEQAPDVNGEKLPPDLAQGNINWRWYDGPAIVGRTNVMSHKQSISSNRSCSTCLCSPTDVWLVVTPDPVQGNAGESKSVTVRQWERGCDGFSHPVAYLGPGDLIWSTSNPFIALGSGLNVSLGAAGTAIIQARRRDDQQVSQFVQTGEFTADGEPVGECQAETVPASGSATVNVQVVTDDVVVVAWVDSAAITLPSGANSQLISDLNSAINCPVLLGSWFLQNPVDLFNQSDENYANAFLVKHSGNSAPPTTIDPSAILSNGDFRLFNRLKAKFTKSGSVVSNPVFLQSSSTVGSTPDPCGLVSPVAGEAHGSNGAKGVTTTGTGVYQLTEGRIGSVGQAVSLLINHRTVPWVWSVIRFDASGNLTTSDHAIFPTYSVYRNGQRIQVIAQASLQTFTANDASYQRLPSQIQ